jgi:putative tricarboxylic transport membrane protein
MSESVSPPPKGRSFSFSIRSPRDFWGGLVLIAVAILAIWASRDLPGQRGFAFGPGTAPRLFAGLLVGLGALVALVGLVTDGPRIEKYKVRGPVLVIASILLFAAMIRPMGMVLASYVTFLVAILGSKEMRVVESVLGAAVMTAFCVGLFVYLLNLPFQLWPRF